MHAKDKQAHRARRHVRVRRRVRGNEARPRLAVFRSNLHIYAQVIDDERGHTVAAASSLDAAVKGSVTGKSEVAKAVGKLVGERAREAGVASVVFDRGGFRYAGRVAALADGAREAGLEF